MVEITKAVVALHNYLMSFRNVTTSSYKYCPHGYVDMDTPQGNRLGQWRKEVAEDVGLISLSHQGSNNYTRSAKEVRDQFRAFLCFTNRSSLLAMGNVYVKTKDIKKCFI